MIGFALVLLCEYLKPRLRTNTQVEPLVPCFPPEIWIQIFKCMYLASDAKTLLVSCKRVSSTWNTLIRDLLFSNENTIPFLPDSEHSKFYSKEITRHLLEESYIPQSLFLENSYERISHSVFCLRMALDKPLQIPPGKSRLRLLIHPTLHGGCLLSAHAHHHDSPYDSTTIIDGSSGLESLRSAIIRIESNYMTRADATSLGENTVFERGAQRIMKWYGVRPGQLARFSCLGHLLNGISFYQGALHPGDDGSSYECCVETIHTPVMSTSHRVKHCSRCWKKDESHENLTHSDPSPVDGLAFGDLPSLNIDPPPTDPAFQYLFAITPNRRLDRKPEYAVNPFSTFRARFYFIWKDYNQCIHPRSMERLNQLHLAATNETDMIQLVSMILSSRRPLATRNDSGQDRDPFYIILQGMSMETTQQLLSLRGRHRHCSPMLRQYGLLTLQGHDPWLAIDVNLDGSNSHQLEILLHGQNLFGIDGNQAPFRFFDPVA